LSSQPIEPQVWLVKVESINYDRGDGECPGVTRAVLPLSTLILSLFGIFPQIVSDAMLAELKQCFMEAYDDNRDGKIDIREVSS